MLRRESLALNNLYRVDGSLSPSLATDNVEILKYRDKSFNAQFNSSYCKTRLSGKQIHMDNHSELNKISDRLPGRPPRDITYR